MTTSTVTAAVGGHEAECVRVGEAEGQHLWNSSMDSSVLTYQLLIGDSREQWMFCEVLHHPDVDFLHICDRVHQALTWPSKHREVSDSVLGINIQVSLQAKHGSIYLLQN